MTQLVGLVRMQHLPRIGVEDDVRIGRGMVLLMLAVPFMHAMGGAVRSMARGRRMDCDRNGESADSTDGASVNTDPLVPTRMIYCQLQSPVSSSQRPSLLTPACGGGEGRLWTD